MTIPLTRPMLVGTVGMAASTHWLASATAMGVLERGGNAFDAAASAGFVLQVVEPHLNGPGGEVPIVVWSEAEQAVRVVCGQGVAPQAATIEHYRDLGLDLVPGTGLLAATVPGAFGAWLAMLDRWGSWSLRAVLEPAIHYARNGFPAIPGVTRTIGLVAEMLTAEWPTSAAAWLPGGEVPATNSMIRNEPLADMYTRVVAEAEQQAGDRSGQLRAAHRIWYAGFVAETIDRFSTGTSWTDSSGVKHSGVLSGQDMADWRPSIEDPVTYDYGRYTVCKTGPWGQGPVFLQQLALLSGVDLDAMGHLSADYLHTVIEASKLAFADREAWYGDSPPRDGLVPALLADDYTASRRALIGDTASFELRPGSPLGLTPTLPAERAATDDEASRGAGEVGEPTVARDGQTRGDTCHVDVADRFGNLVSATPSGGWLQSSPYIPELGFALGTRAQMFWLEPGLPNSLRPGARPRTTLSPSIALRDGKPWLAFGTPGGDQQDQWTLGFFLAVVHGGLDLQAAIESPAYHTEHFRSSFYPRQSVPGRIIVEDRVGDDVLDELRRRGHDVVGGDPWSLGRVSAAGREDGYLVAAANPRGAQGYAVGR